MRPHCIRTILISAILMIASLHPAWAGIPVLTMESRNIAPEALAIHVNSVDRQRFVVTQQGLAIPEWIPFNFVLSPVAGYEKITVHARITGVSKTKDGLQVGQDIRITYNNQTIVAGAVSGCTPPNTPVLKAGIDYPAFLRLAQGGDYTPIAGGPVPFMNASGIPVDTDISTPIPTFWFCLMAAPILGVGVVILRRFKAR